MIKKYKVVKKVIKDDEALERYLMKKSEEENKQDIEYLLEKVINNPNVTEEMIEPRLRKYLSIVKREYKKETLTNEHKKIR